VEMSPISVTRTIPSASLSPSLSTPDSLSDGGSEKDTEATREVTIVRSLVAHLENDIVVLSLHTHFHLADMSKSMRKFFFVYYLILS